MYEKKNLSIVLVVLLALLLIALVIWRCDKKIKNIDQKIKQPVAYLNMSMNRPLKRLIIIKTIKK
jgi:uncharacterized membrane protein YidH (DUF202 family)